MVELVGLLVAWGAEKWGRLLYSSYFRVTCSRPSHRQPEQSSLVVRGIWTALASFLRLYTTTLWLRSAATSIAASTTQKCLQQSPF